jgi:HSP20 family molecular chaperone IbpA
MAETKSNRSLARARGARVPVRAQASFKNGVLEISMQAPPAEATRGRRIEIKDAAESGEQR